MVLRHARVYLGRDAVQEQRWVHFIDGAGDGLYHQGILAVDYERITAVLRVGANGRLVRPSPKVRIWSGPVGVNRRIYRVARLRGYRVEL